MDIQEIVAKKQEVEQRIKDLITEFQDATQLEVAACYLQFHQEIGTRKKVLSAQLDVRVTY